MSQETTDGWLQKGLKALDEMKLAPDPEPTDPTTPTPKDPWKFEQPEWITQGLQGLDQSIEDGTFTMFAAEQTGLSAETSPQAAKTRTAALLDDITPIDNPITSISEQDNIKHQDTCFFPIVLQCILEDAPRLQQLKGISQKIAATTTDISYSLLHLSNAADKVERYEFVASKVITSLLNIIEPSLLETRAQKDQAIRHIYNRIKAEGFHTVAQEALEAYVEDCNAAEIDPRTTAQNKIKELLLRKAIQGITVFAPTPTQHKGKKKGWSPS